MRCRTPWILTGVSSVAAALLSCPHDSFAQSTPAARIEAIERQIRALQEELQRVKSDLGSTNEQLRRSQEETRRSQEQARQAQDDARRAQEQAKTVAEKTPALSFPDGRPTLSTPDGRASLAIGMQMHLDTGTYFQHAPSGTDTREPVGARDLNSGVNLRRGRIIFLGRFDDWTANLTPDFGGSPDGSPSIFEASVNYAGIKPLTFTVGYFKPWLTLQDSMSPNDFLFMERPSIVEIGRNLAAGDARASAGVRAATEDYLAAAYYTRAPFGAQNESLLNDEQTGGTLRLATRPLRGEDWNLHLGFSGSMVFSPNQNNAEPGTVAAPRESIQLRDRPELRIDQNRLIDTGLIPVKSADEYGIELAASWRNFLLQGEYIRIDVDQSDLGRANAPTLGFDGGYIEGSWVITGEPRRYVASSAAFARPKPADPFTLGGGWGAWELVARYSITDLNSHSSRGVPASVTGGVFGGRQEVYSAGLSWYPNDAIRFILQYQYVDVSRLDPTGSVSVGQNFHTLAGRAQVAF